jgi:hypothetical protein
LGALRLGEHFPEVDTQTQFGMIAYDGVQGFERGVAAFDEKVVHSNHAASRGAPGP